MLHPRIQLFFLREEGVGGPTVIYVCHGVPWHIFSNVTMFILEIEFDLEEGGGEVRTSLPLDPLFSAFTTFVCIIF